MSRDEAYLIDILESARTAIEYMRGKSRLVFSKDSLLQDAVVRRLEIIGEAAGYHPQLKRNTQIFHGKP